MNTSIVNNVGIEEPLEEEWTYDPNEPRYCICNQVSYGDMVACDNQDVSQNIHIGQYINTPNAYTTKIITQFSSLRVPHKKNGKTQ